MIERRRVASGGATPLSVTVIVPFHRGLDQLERCLSAMKPCPPRTEVIVAADGAVDCCDEVANRLGARVVHLIERRGPAAARNRAAATSQSDLLIFVDADVVASSDSLHAMAGEFARNPDVAVMFGTYDHAPAAPNFVSQYKNLAHAYGHMSSGRMAQSFWAGFGGIRRDVFNAIGGFDEAFTRPSIEDIELGDRLIAAGHKVVVDRRLHACHLKQWTFWSMVKSDLRDRGIPWTRLILRSRRFHNTLNIDTKSRFSVVFAWLGLTAAVLGFVDARLWIAATIALLTLGVLNRSLYRFFLRERGFSFAVRAVGLHFLYHLYNGIAFAVGAALHYRDQAVARRRMPNAKQVVQS
jgi:cellulose synthase/poly-beta-1,6-N-acetylglucosamine synthase-like glycosyltransferase